MKRLLNTPRLLAADALATASAILTGFAVLGLLVGTVRHEHLFTALAAGLAAIVCQRASGSLDA